MMNSLLQGGVILVALLCATSSPAPVFMQYGDIKGSVIAAGYGGWIDILTLSNPFNPASPQASASSSMVLTRQVDIASPKLFQYCANGTTVPKARIEWTDSSGFNARFLEVRLHNVRISSYATSAHADGLVVPTESISLNFEKITWTYTTRDPRSRLPLELQTTSLNLDDGTATASTNLASFAMTGIRKTSDQVELRWQGVAGNTYDVYAVTSLTGPFSLQGQTTAPADGPMTYTAVILPGMMFFVVEERP